MTALDRQVVLRADGVHVERRRRAVVRGASLTLRCGEIVTLLGPNGAGKSTLLAALAGLLKPSSGQIDIGGRVAAALQAPALAHRSVRANVEAALAWWGVPRTERRPRALAALDRCGAAQLADRAAGTLSGGEARRVHLARALAVDPDVLLLDEPFAGLDATARADLLYDAASALRSETRATLVIVHDRGEAWALGDRVLVLIDGVVQAEGTPAEVFDYPPSPTVASFVGFEGRLEEADGVRMLRASHVEVDPHGPIEGRVTRRIPLEDGFRLEVEVDHGMLVTTTADPAIRTDDAVRLRLDGGAYFPASPTPVGNVH